jgi:hypothetical protein
LVISLLVVLISLFLLFTIITPADIIGHFLNIKINNTDRFNDTIYKVNLIGVIIILLTFIYLAFNAIQALTRIKNYLVYLLHKSLRAFNIKLLFFLCFFYYIVITVIGIVNYDLGIDEVSYIVYAKSFYHFLLPYCTTNGTMLGGQLYLIDNFAMLPFYILSALFFVFNPSEVWQYKFFVSILSFLSIYVICYILFKRYNFKWSAFFLFLLIIQPGFGFVQTSFFGEIVECAFFFMAVYIWLKNDEKQLNKIDIVIISLLFALTAQTKMQILPSLTAAFVIFYFYDRSKKSIPILFLTILFYFVIAFIRTIPALVYHISSIAYIIKYWYLTILSSGTDILTKIIQIQLFNHFFPLLFFSMIFYFAYFIIKKPFEKFIYIFTLVYFIWYIFSFPFVTYRHLIIGLVPALFLATYTLFGLSELLQDKKIFHTNTAKLVTVFFIALLLTWGFSVNFIYAYIGYNDGVQFDLDGTKSLFLHSFTHDDTQKLFYREIKNKISENDSIYIGSGGQSMFLTQFYLPDNPLYDFDHLKQALEKSDNIKYVIIDRVSFPLGIEEGRKLLDSLNVNKILLLKEGDFELYSVYRPK